MKVQDLKKYKTLDITELSGSPWNTAEKVLGLDENDKVVMAEPEEVVTPEYVDNAIDQAMETETARTESTYLKEHQSLEDYYTKEEVDQAIEDVEVDLSDYYTKAEVDEAIDNVDVSDQLANYALISSVTADINTAIANETARTENTYAKKSEIPSLNGYATEAWVEGKGYITGVTVDAEFTSGSTNAVQSKAIYDAFYGTSSSAQMEIIESATTGVYLAVWAGSYYFKETNIPGYLALNLGEYISSDSYISQIKDGSWKNIDGSPIGGSLHTSGLGVKCPISNFSGVSGLWFNAENLDGTYDYYMVYNQDDSYAAFYKTLPVITVEAPGILDDYAKTTDIPVIPTNVSAFNNDAGYLTSHQDISGKLDTSVFNTYTGNTETILDSKADVSDIPDVSDFATSGEVATQIGTAMASETARTEDVYAKKSEIPGLDNYYTKSETDEAIEEAISGISLEGYWTSAQTKNYVDAEITGATAFETARTESTYAKKSEIPSLDGYATEQYVDNAIADIPPVDLSAYAKTTAVTQDIQTAIATETGRTEDAYIKKNLYSGNDSNSITAIKKGVFNTGTEKYDGIFNEYVVPTSGAKGGGFTDVFVKKINGESIIETLSGIQTKQNIELPTFSDVSTAITDSMQTETARTESTYAKKTDVPSLDGYWTSAETENAIAAATDDMATETWVGQQGYLTQHQDISGKLDASTFNTYTGATETVLEGKADISDIPDVSDFVTSGEVATQIGTAMASETARTESTYLKEHQDISSKLDVSTFNTYTGATETVLNGKADISDIPDVSGFVTSGDVETRIDDAVAAETARTESTYLKEHQDISGKVDKTDFNTYTGATATAIAAKQDTLVSGTNIKTINNQSLLGSGNITIQGGGGGGGETVVELTKAQYEALDPPAADTTYIITDADVVDLNDYAKASGLTELSGTVETLSSTKADKQNVTARTSGNYLPRWNNQGVITGEYSYYSNNLNINGSSVGNVFKNSSSAFPNIYAPTSAGTEGQPLLSNGSGAPVWGGYKFAFITQTAYDALATKDSTTIYFIVGE